MVQLFVFDRWDNFIRATDAITCTRIEEVNGEDTLVFTTIESYEKGQRIVFQDGEGVWHEHVVTEIEESREERYVLSTVTAEDSLCETLGDFIEDLRNQNTTASVALSKALSVTRWEQGATSALGNASQNFYQMSARAAINAVAETWGGEIYKQIDAGTKGITRRRVSIVSRIGSNRYKRFEYRKDLTSIRREVNSDDVVTALYGYGSGLAATDDEGNETGGFTRKITFGDINGGKNYVADEEALEAWGRPDGKGGKAHVFGTVEFSDCEDPKVLLSLTKEELPKRTVPSVTYTANVIDLQAAGFEYEGVALGDDVQIVDTAFVPALELQGRVLRIEWNYRDPSQTVITLGNIQPAITDDIYRQSAALQTLRDHAGAWDKAAVADHSYISGVINSINAVMNATGGYVYMQPGEGITVYNKPIEQNPTGAIQLNGAGFRIANSKTGDEWNWKTFGTADGFTAECLIAGIIKGGKNWWNLETGDLMFQQGGIRDSKGKNYWNLDTGEFALSSTATVGGKTVQAIADGAVDAQTQRDIFNKLTNNGQTQGIYLQNGLLYINANYLETGIISDRYGRNSWNLTTGTLETNNMTAKNINATGTLKTGTTYSMELSGGTLKGKYDDVQVMQIDTNLRFQSGEYGGRITSPYYLVIRVPKLAIDQSTTGNGTICATEEGTHISRIEDAGNGTIRWWTATHKFVNGLCMYM